MTSQLGLVGNPSSLHAAGRAARRVVEEARESLAQALGARPSEVVFTGGGTEADNLAIKGLYWARRAEDPRRSRILASAVEHHAVMDCALWLAEHEARAGRVAARGPATAGSTPRRCEPPLAEDPDSVALVSVMWANNEVGTVQPIAELAVVAHEFGVPIPLRRRAGPRSAAGRLHRERAGRDDRHRSQDRRTARRRGAGPEPRAGAHTGAARRRPGARRPVRHPRHPGHRRLRGGRRGRRQAPARARRAARRGCATTWYDGSPPPYPTPSSVATPTCHPRIGSRATRTSPSPAARATPCSCCWTRAASSAPPAPPARRGCRSPAMC